MISSSEDAITFRGALIFRVALLVRIVILIAGAAIIPDDHRAEIMVVHPMRLRCLDPLSDALYRMLYLGPLEQALDLFQLRPLLTQHPYFKQDTFSHHSRIWQFFVPCRLSRTRSKTEARSHSLSISWPLSSCRQNVTSLSWLLSRPTFNPNTSGDCPTTCVHTDRSRNLSSSTATLYCKYFQIIF